MHLAAMPVDQNLHDLHMARRNAETQSHHGLQAQAKYAEMRRLDAAALDATQALGCPSCRAAAQAAAASRVAEQPHQAEGTAAMYQQLHTPLPWPAAASAGECQLDPRMIAFIHGTEGLSGA